MNRLIIADLLTPLLPPEDRLVVLDVGARDALADPRWAALRRARIYGFDPDAAEVERLNAEAQAAGVDARYFPVALWSASAPLTFIDNNAPGGGSFFEQNRALTDRWKFECIDGQKTLSRDLFYPTEARQVEAMSLDDWATREGVTSIDFLKMNIQGAELDVLCGATILQTCLGVLAEVSFVESYKGRPMFSDIDSYLRRAGFEFFDLINFHQVGRVASPFTAQHSPSYRATSMGQLIEAHALYLRDPFTAPEKWGWANPSWPAKLACVAEAFGQAEFAFEVLSEMARHDERFITIFDAAAAQYQAEYGVKIAA